MEHDQKIKGSQEEIVETPQNQKNTKPIDTSDWQTYTNEEFGFAMKLPGDMKKYVYTIEKNNQKRIKGSPIATLDVRYMLDHKVLQSPQQPELGFIEDMTVWYIDIIPREEYMTDFCAVNHIPLCRQGDVLGQNDTYVFLAGFVNVEGVGYLCAQNIESQSHFCRVSDIFGREDIAQIIDFTMVK